MPNAIKNLFPRLNHDDQLDLINFINLRLCIPTVLVLVHSIDYR